MLAAQAPELRETPKRSPAPGVHAHPHAIGTATGTVEGIARKQVPAVVDLANPATRPTTSLWPNMIRY